MDIAKVRDLLHQALSLLDESEPLVEPGKDDLGPEIRLTGKVGRPEYKEPQGLALWEAGLKIKENGEEKWINIQAWRKTAIYARANCPSAELISAVGRWKHEEWTGPDGVPRERDVFVISHFTAVYDIDSVKGP